MENLFMPMMAWNERLRDDQLNFPVLASYKLPGSRAIVRNGVAVNKSLLSYRNPFLQAFFQLHPELEGLDGKVDQSAEVLNNLEWLPNFNFYVFEDINARGTAMDRYEHLKARFSDLEKWEVPHVHLVDQFLIHNYEELRQLTAVAKQLGYDAVILKKPRSAYKYGRSTPKDGVLMKWSL